MKNTLFALFFLFCVASAFGQTSAPVLPNVSAPMIMSEHPQHASQHDMAQEQSLFGSDKRVTPLGDIARSLRREHEAARKAEIIWEND